MGRKTFDTFLRLVGKGYTVTFSKAEDFRPATVLRIELRKKDNHHVELIDISIKHLLLNMNTDDLISRALEKAEWEFEYNFGREKNV